MDAFKIHFQHWSDRIKDYHQQYGPYLPAMAFGAGFLLDIFTLGEVDDWSNIFVLTVYLLGVLAILITEYLEIDKSVHSNTFISNFFIYRNDIFHFMLGALLSAFTLFFFKSSSLSNSFIFMILMVSLLLLNEIEFFKRQGIIMRSALSMLCFVSYLVYLIPIFAGRANSIIFYSCTLMALAASITGHYYLTKYNSRKWENLKKLLLPQLAVVLTFASLYTLKILPPIPLSIKEIGIYHDVQKTDGKYITRDLTSWLNFWSSGDTDFQARAGDKVYVFAKIFSPGGFAGKIYLRWLKKTQDGYITSDRITLKITGGRAQGYRGYAYKSNYSPGQWQVRIETEEGLEIGRIGFEIFIDPETQQRNYNEISH